MLLGTETIKIDVCFPYLRFIFGLPLCFYLLSGRCFVVIMLSLIRLLLPLNYECCLHSIQIHILFHSFGSATSVSSFIKKSRRKLQKKNGKKKEHELKGCDHFFLQRSLIYVMSIAHPNASNLQIKSNVFMYCCELIQLQPNVDFRPSTRLTQQHFVHVYKTTFQSCIAHHIYSCALLRPNRIHAQNCFK